MFIRSAIKYFAVGVSGILVSVLTYNILLFIPYFDHHYLFTNIIGASLATLNNFVWNDLWTFGHRQKKSSWFIRFVNYSFIAIISMILGTYFLAIMVHHFGINKRIGNVISVLLMACMSYLFNYMITFRE